MRRYEQLSLLLGDLIATHHTNYNGDGKPGHDTAFFKYVRYTKKVRTRQCRVPTGLLNVPHKSAICCIIPNPGYLPLL
ncbi:MAG: hypothetical protein HC789_07025 [Microcoleus sp. CSU_2_2]|nr:hypothetical protein [Microcoleus sp. CSU_2_2]